VRDALFQAGWHSVYFARVDDLGMPVPDPETLRRAFVIAHK